MTLGNWLFSDPKNVACFTEKSIMNGKQAILLVSHDAEDGSWQFLPGGNREIANAIMVSLEEIAHIDPSIFELTNLSFGWKAIRKSAGDPWVLSENDDG